MQGCNLQGKQEAGVNTAACGSSTSPHLSYWNTERLGAVIRALLSVLRVPTLAVLIDGLDGLCSDQSLTLFPGGKKPGGNSLWASICILRRTLLKPLEESSHPHMATVGGRWLGWTMEDLRRDSGHSLRGEWGPTQKETHEAAHTTLTHTSWNRIFQN